jgi:hypothetical protein
VIVDNDGPTPVAGSLPDHVFHLCLPGERGVPYRIEASDNLTDWFPVHDAVCEDGNVRYADSTAEALRHRFYRLRPVVVEALDLGD